jgi:DNA-binding transcriptional regulator YhcF (GntR family)
MQLRVKHYSPIPSQLQLTEQLKPFLEGGGSPRHQALPSIRELARFLGINRNVVARGVESLKRAGYVEARRGNGVSVVQDSPAAPPPPPARRRPTLVAARSPWTPMRGTRGRRGRRLMTSPVVASRGPPAQW